MKQSVSVLRSQNKALTLTTGSVTNSATGSGGGATSNLAAATINTTGTNPGPTPRPGDTIQHQVVEGEWMLQIARCYGANYNEVRLANTQIPDLARIKPG